MVDLLCELKLRICGTSALDTLTGRAWMSCGECRAVESTTTETKQVCDVCPVGKSKQQAHPKKATYGVQHAFQLVTVDLM